MKKYTTIQMTSELHQELKTYCDKNGIGNLSKFVEYAVRNHIKPAINTLRSIQKTPTV